MYTLLIMTLEVDLKENYGGYHSGWQWIGALIPLLHLLVFLYYFFTANETPSLVFQDHFNEKLIKKRFVKQSSQDVPKLDLELKTVTEN
jgi:hypothetical protein